MRLTFDGPTSAASVHRGYWRLKSDQTAEPPYTFAGRFRLTEVMDPPVFADGTPAWYEPALVFHPMYPSNDRNIVLSIGRRSKPTGVGISAEMRDLRPDQPYGVRTGYVSRTRVPLSDPMDGAWHTFRCEVLSYAHYQLFVDDTLVADVVEREPATIDRGPVSVGLRLDFCHVEFADMTLTQPGLLGRPIPPRPDVFSPHGAPPGVAVDFDAVRAPDGSPWWRSRPVIKPRLQLVHTNAAPHEGSLQSQINWANAAPNNTKPHYAVNRPQPTKLVPSDRRAIGNATEEAFEAPHGDVSFWSIVIETADGGYLADPAIGPFLDDHAEIVARILAYESIVHGIPLEYPAAWWGAGTACHTEPFGWPYWTKARGKTCPGPVKKAQVREQILPRARQIKAAWLATTEEDDMAGPSYIVKQPARYRGSGSIFVQGGAARYATTPDVEWAQSNGVPMVDVIDEQYVLLHRFVFGVDPVEVG